MDGSFLKLLHELVSEFQDPRFLWEVGVLAACLALTAFLQWQFRHRAARHEGERSASERGIRRLFFPVVALLLVLVARAVLRQFNPVGLLNVAIPLLLSLAVVRASVFALRYVFPRAQWLAASEKLIAATVWFCLALYITGLSDQVIDALESVKFAVGKQKLDLWQILHGIVTVLLTVIVALWVAGVLESRLMRVEALDSSLRIVGVRVAKALLTVAALFLSLSLVGIDMTALSVFTGALGVGLGFGLQKIASNYVSGFIILLDRSIRIGNIVQVGSDSGQVTQITTRYTVLKHPAGTEFIVPNETLISSTVQNQTYSDTRQRLSTTVGVAYDSDLDQVRQVLKAVAAAHPRILKDPAPSVLLTQFADSSINLELGFWIADPEEGKANAVSEINFAIWRAFREQGISIPFPQREVRVLNPQPSGAVQQN